MGVMNFAKVLSSLVATMVFIFVPYDDFTAAKLTGATVARGEALHGYDWTNNGFEFRNATAVMPVCFLKNLEK